MRSRVAGRANDFMKASGAAAWKLRRFFRFRKEVVVDAKESVDRAVKNYDFDALTVSIKETTSSNCGMLAGPKMFRGGRSNVTRQIFRRYPVQTNFSCNRCCTDLRLLF